MACPTCDATLAGLGEIDGRRHWHCTRCGTHVIKDASSPDHITVPVLVGRCRQFQYRMHTNLSYYDWWKQMGIAEAINTPDNRPR